MARPASLFRYCNTTYCRKQFEIHGLSQLKSSRGATPEDNYDKEYLITILPEQTRLNLKYGQIFADQSNDSKHVTEANNGTSESKIEQQKTQSQSNRTFQNKNGVSKIKNKPR